MSLTQPGSCFAAPPATVLDFVPIPGAPAGVADAYVKPSVFPGCFANGLPKSEGAALAATQRPLATNAFTEESGVPAWATIPSWAVIGTEDHAITPASQLAMANRANAHITKIDAPHLSMLSDPRAVARVIEQAAERRHDDGNGARPRHRRDFRHSTSTYQQRWYEANAVHTTKGASQ